MSIVLDSHKIDIYYEIVNISYFLVLNCMYINIIMYVEIERVDGALHIGLTAVS